MNRTTINMLLSQWIVRSGVKANALSTLLLVGLLFSVATQTGCRRKVVIKKQRVTVAPTASKTSPFDMAFEFLNNLEQYQPGEVGRQVINNLRVWADEEEASVSWIADPMFRRLPKDLKEKYTTEMLTTKSFDQFDFDELRQSVWLRDVSKTVAQRSLEDPRLRKWIEDAVQRGELSKDDADDLSLAYRLFDWTVRNVQLEPELDPVDFELGQEGIDKRDPSTLRRQMYPWQNLLYGHGDYEERSRLFMLLCRQVGVNCVMLVADRGDDQLRQPWVNGVLLGEELYLFDAKLGLPLPGQGRAPFGKLTDYVANPAMLDQFTIDAARYRIVASDLKKLVASIDATPAALSQRMKQIESRLQGDNKMVLTVAPTPLAKQLRKCKHINSVEIWPFPYRGYQFYEKFKMFLNDPSSGEDTPGFFAVLARMQYEQRPFSSRGTIMQGRLLQLRGFDRGDFDTPGAKKLYMNSRMAKKDIEKFSVAVDELPEDSPMLQGMPKDPAKRRALFQAGREMAVSSKDRATYWLGTISINTAEYKVASDFFKLIVADENSSWRQSANYNLGRAYEAIGVRDGDSEMIKKAIECYESDRESPQLPGNLLRAKRLERSSS